MKFLYRILPYRKIIRFLSWTKKVTLPGFDRMPIYEVAVFFINGVNQGGVNTRASALAFNFFLALFPAIIFFFTLIPYVPIDNFQEQLLAFIQAIMPYNAFEAARTTIEDIIQHQRGGLLSIGVIAALYFATNGINAMIDGFNRSIHTVETRTNFQQRIISLVLTIIITVLFILAVALIILSEHVVSHLIQLGILRDIVFYYLLIVGKWIIVISLFLSAISFLYYLGPSKKREFKFVSAGSSIATILSILSSIGFSFFVNNFGQYNKLYGSIGTLIVILIWIYINAMVLILGFELNASIGRARKTKTPIKR